MKSYSYFLNENFMVGKDYDKFEKLIVKYGFEHDDSTHEHRYYARLDQGVIGLYIDNVRKQDTYDQNHQGKAVIRNYYREDPDMFQWQLQFHPYVKVEKKLFGLIKKRILAKSVDLKSGIFDFGYGMFAADDDKILAELEKTIKEAIKKVEKLDPEELYKEENITGKNNNLPSWISGSKSGGFSPIDILYKRDKDITDKVYEGWDYDKQQLVSFVSDMADELSNWGTSKPKREDAILSAEVVTDGDPYLVKAIIKYVKDVKDKKGAAEWLVDAAMSSAGNPAKQKEFLSRLRKTI